MFSRPAISVSVAAAEVESGASRVVVTLDSSAVAIANDVPMVQSRVSAATVGG